MTYRIGEVSKALNISDQMIRYYEKNGVISPKRSGGGSFREYTDRDIFLLFEAVKYKEWGIGIGDIADIVNCDYFQKLPEELEKICGRLKEEIREKQILAERIRDVSRRLRLCRCNIGRYWIDEKPAVYLYFGGTSTGDRYSISQVDGEMQKVIMSPRNISFFDVVAQFHPDQEVWWYGIERTYHDALGIADSGAYKKIPEEMCLCSVIEMGDFGEFGGGVLEPVFSYMRSEGLALSGGIYGTIIGRGTQEGKFTRVMEIRVPVGNL